MVSSQKEFEVLETFLKTNDKVYSEWEISSYTIYIYIYETMPSYLNTPYVCNRWWCSSPYVKLFIVAIPGYSGEEVTNTYMGI